MPGDKVKMVVATAVILAALLILYFTLHEPAPAVETRPHEALGQVLAEEATKLASTGGRLIVIRRDTAKFKNPAAEAQWKGFCGALRQAKLTIALTNLVALDPLNWVQVPPGDFLEIMRRQTDADVIVSFLGPPLLTGEQMRMLGNTRPRIVSACTGWMPRQVNLKELFGQQLLHVAIISHPNMSSVPTRSSNLRDWFDYFYQVVTTANLTDLPVPK